MTDMARHSGRRSGRIRRRFAPMLTAFVMVAAVISALPAMASAQASNVTVFTDDFESDTGWQANPNGTDTASTGRWERANPEPTSMQLGDTTSGSNGLVTGASAGSSLGSNDIDGGVTSIQSPVISLADVTTAELSFDYYMAHLSNASSADFFRVSVIGATTQTVLSEVGQGDEDDPSWQRANIDISEFAGQSIRLLVEASDASFPSLIEAGLDTLSITGTSVVVNGPPVVVNPGPQSSVEGDVVSLQLEATDPDFDALDYLAIALVPGLTLDLDTGEISGTIAAGAAADSPYDVSITVTDGVNPVPVSFTWTVGTGANLPPVAVNPGPQQSAEGDVISLQLEATDPEGQPLQYFTEGVLPGLTLDGSTGLISGTVAEGAADGSPYGIFVAVSDGVNPVLVSFEWTIVGANGNQAPVVNNPGPQQSEEGDSVELQIVGTDGDEDALTWAATGLPADLSIDPATGVISGTVAEGTQSNLPYGVVVSANDGTDTTEVSFEWRVGSPTNLAPVIIAPATPNSVEGDEIILALTGIDPEGSPLNWSAVGLPADLSIDPTTGVISGTVAAGASVDSPYSVSVSATDGELVSTSVITWLVSDGETSNTIITGTIFNADGTPFVPAEVDQYTVGPDGQRGEFILSRANVPNGVYTIFTEPGCFFMTFIAPDGQTYNGGTFFTPEQVCVEEGGTGVVNAILDSLDAPTTSIGGTVISADGGAEGVQVDLFLANPDGSRGGFVNSTTTGADGTYSFDVQAGCFVMTFVAPEGDTFNGQGFFNNSGCVGGGEIVTDINAVLDSAVVSDAAIGGTVTLGDGSPAVGVGIDLFAQAADGSRGEYLESTTTIDGGVYNFDVDAGCYVLTFIAPAGETFDGTGFLSLPQCVESGEVVTDLDAPLDSEAASAIGGTVTDGLGAPAPGVVVDLFEANADGSRGTYLDSGTTDAEGIYSILADAGCYVLTFIATDGDTFNGSRFLSLPQCVEAGQTITDLDAAFDSVVVEVEVSVADVSVTEGDVDAPVDVTVSLSGPADVDVSVDVATADGTAVAGEDYMAVSSAVVIPAGELSATVSVMVIGDDVEESEEAFTVSLSNPVGAVIGAGTATVTIADDDAPVVEVEVSVADVSVTEGDVDAPVDVTVSLSGPADVDVSVDVASADGTAVAGEDYMAVSSAVVIPAGELSVTVSVMVIGDDVEESEEAFTVSLSNPVGAVIGAGTATVTIADDDAPVVEVEVSVADVSVTEGDVDAPVDVTVSLSGPADVDVSVDVASADGTAVAGEDYMAVSSAVVIPAGELSVTVSVMVIGDDVEESEEAFTVSLSNPVGAVIGAGTATVTIADDDAPTGVVTISVGDVTVTELNDGLRNAIVTFTLSEPTDQTVVIQYTTVDGTATLADNDYIARSGEVRFLPGVTTRSRAVQTVGDRNIEPDETLTVELSDPVNAIIGDGVGVITILNND